MPLSDADLWGAPQGSAPQAATAQPMSDDDLWGAPKKSAPAGDGSPNRSAEAAEALMAGLKGEQSMPLTAIQMAGSGAGYVLDNTVAPVMKPVAKALAPAAKTVADYVDKYAPSISDTLLAGKEKLEQEEKDHPVLARTVKAAANLTAANGLRNSLADVGEGAAQSLERPTGVFPKAEGIPTQPFDSTNAFNEINKTYGERMDKANGLYDDVRQTASGKMVEAPGVRDTLSDIIGDIQNDPIHEGRMALGTLKRISDKIGPDDTMDLGDVVQVKQMLNRGFNPKRFSDAADSPYVQLSKSLEQTLNDAAETHQDFGQSKAIADNYWTNRVVPLRDNPVLNRIWKPEDHFNQESVNAGRLDNLPDETAERADNLLDNISNKHELRAVTRALPGDVADDLRNAKLDQMQDKFGYVKPLVKTVVNAAKMNVAGTLKNAANIGAKYTPEEKSLLDELNSSTLNKDTNGALKGVVYPPQKPPNSTIYGNAPPPTAAITHQPDAAMVTPTSDVVGVNKEGVARPFTQEEESANQARRNNGLDPDTIRANLARARGDAAGRHTMIEHQPGSTEAFENEPTPLWLSDPKTGQSRPATRKEVADFSAQYVAKQTRDRDLGMTPGTRAAQERSAQAPAAAPLDDANDVIKQADDFFKKNGLKRGGVVKADPSPTEAQKMAGNYKKGHLKVHGLDISIENHKGGIRHGIGKDGKKWAVAMPDHYGYIRKTQGADGDHVDCYVGPNHGSRRVYVIDQKDHETGKFDEHKVMIGYATRDDAVSAYKSAFSDKKNRMMHISRMSIEEFKDWLKDGNTKTQFKKVD